MKFRKYKYLIFSDLYRLRGTIKINLLIKELIFGEAYKYIFWMRTCKFLKENMIFKYTLFIIARIMLTRYMYKFQIGIPYSTDINSGFYIGHFSGIFIHPDVIIGKNCNISQGVTLGKVNRGKNLGVPSIENNCYIGPGVKIIGNVKIGDNVAIGSNSVITKDIPDNSVVVGIPAKIISEEGSSSYVNFTDYNKYFKEE